MKRTRTLSLVMMSTSALFLTACDEPQTEVTVYETLEQCVADGLDAEFCQKTYNLAQQEHLRAAPRYRSAQECATDFGPEQCQEHRTSSGSSIFMPLMMGYMMSRMMGGGGGFMGQPLYRSRDDRSTYRTADNRPVARSNGPVQVARSIADAPPSRSNTVKRGGFGSQAKRYTPARSSGG